MRRWLTTAELGEALAKRDPRVAQLSRRHRTQYARRLVRRAERCEDVRCTKRVGALVYISLRALEVLLPPDVATVDRLDIEFSKLVQEHRGLRGQVNGHGSTLREHGKRLSIVEKKAAILARCQADLAAADAE